MKKIYRRLLLFTSTVSFLTLAPLIVLYAIGYRANLHEVDPLPVGVISIATVPRRANITVNGENSGTSPRTVANVEPGQAQVDITKDGYLPWSKKLTVQPGRAVDLNDVLLLPSQITPTVLAENITAAALAPNLKMAAVAQADKTLLITDQAGEPIADKIKLAGVSDRISWSPNSGWVLLHMSADGFAAIDTSRPQTARSLTALAGAKQADWEAKILGRILFIDKNNNLKVYNLSTGAAGLIAPKIASFISTPQAIYTLDVNGQMAAFTLQGETMSLLPPVPAGKINKIIASASGNLMYLMKDGGLWFVDENNQLKQIADTALAAGWSPNQAMIYVQTDPHTLYVFNISDERAPEPLHELTLITRLSRKISKPLWFDNNHIVYQSEGEIWLTETDTRDHALASRIDQTNLTVSDLAVSSDALALYYTKQINGHKNLVLASLQVPDKK